VIIAEKADNHTSNWLVLIQQDSVSGNLETAIPAD
jgi:hypothetical protein